MFVTLLICATIIGFAIAGCNHAFGAQSPHGSQTFPRLGKRTTAPALPPLPPGFQIAVDTNLYMLGIKKTNANNIYLTWTGPAGTVFQLTTKTNVNQLTWANVGSETTNRSAVVPINARFSIFKVRSATSPVLPGQLQWVKSQQAVSSANSVKVDSAGNVIIVGSFRDAIDFGTGLMTAAGGTIGDIFVAKYNPQGSILWSKAFGAAHNDSAESVSIDSSNNIVVTGYFSDTVNFGGVTLTNNSSSFDVFVAKFNPAGALLWAKSFGGANLDRGYAVTVNKASGEIILAASFEVTANFGGVTLTSHGTSIALVKLSAAGNVIWAKERGDTGTVSSAIPQDLAVYGNGDVGVTGEFVSQANLGGGIIGIPGNSYSLFVAKYSGVDGSYQWAKSTGSTDQNNKGYGIAIDGTGNAVITGKINGTVDLGRGPIATIGTAAFMAGYNSSGNCIWTRVFTNLSTSGIGQGLAVSVDNDGAVALSGNLQGSADFGGGFLSGGGSPNIFVASFLPAMGNTPPVYRWAKTLNGITGIGNGIGFDSSGHVVPCGSFVGTVDFGGISATGFSPSTFFVAEYNK